jgi:hypothetical protein
MTALAMSRKVPSTSRPPLLLMNCLLHRVELVDDLGNAFAYALSVACFAQESMIVDLPWREAPRLAHEVLSSPTRLTVDDRLGCGQSSRLRVDRSTELPDKRANLRLIGWRKMHELPLDILCEAKTTWCGQVVLVHGRLPACVAHGDVDVRSEEPNDGEQFLSCPFLHTTKLCLLRASRCGPRGRRGTSQSTQQRTQQQLNNAHQPMMTQLRTQTGEEHSRWHAS